MIDWTKSMQQTYEYYIVDPGTWKDVKKIETVKTSSITRDSELETLGSATIDMDNPIGECYIRIYLIAIQNGEKHKEPLATIFVQTPSLSFDGKTKNVSMDAYTPLLELKENKPDLGYFVPKEDSNGAETNIMDSVYNILRGKVRAPIVRTIDDSTLYDHFVSDTDDTWLSFLSDLLLRSKYSFDLDPMGRILFAPQQDIASLQPVWTYSDDNSSILYPDITLKQDLYGIPNTVEVIYSDNSRNLYSKVVNDDPNSLTSTISRGRVITYRSINPEFSGHPTQSQIDEYARKLLRDLSSVEYKLTYTHGYCPVRVGDCVRFNYLRSGLRDIKAKVISQTIKCEPGCPVSETAIFTTRLWE